MTNAPLDSVLYSQVDVCCSIPVRKPSVSESLTEISQSMRELLSFQRHQTELLTELVAQVQRTQHRKAIELGLWKRSNPELADFCKRASVRLERVQTDLLSTITREIDDNFDSFMDSEFMLNEFVDRFGMKFMHLNSMLHILSQLGNAPDLQINQPPETSKVQNTETHKDG